jgi:methionyl-tRNA formyltransferase
MGSGGIGVPTLEWLLESGRVELVGVVTQPDKPAGRSQTLTAPLPKIIAERSGVPVLQPGKVRLPEALETVRELGPDLIVVMAYGQILPKALLDMPSLACLNLHASLLPKHRGAAPIQASILAGDAQSGITVMYMAAGLDTGDILLKRPLAIRRRETGESLHDRLALLGPAALAESIDLLIDGNAPRLPQEEELANYAPKLDRESGRIEWSESCQALDRRIRAMYSWPGAYTLAPVPATASGEKNAEETMRKKLKIHRALPMHRRTGHPGEVLGMMNRGILVACGVGGLLLLEVQLEGKRRMPAAEFVRGFGLEKGAVLG